MPVFGSTRRPDGVPTVMGLQYDDATSATTPTASTSPRTITQRATRVARVLKEFPRILQAFQVGRVPAGGQLEDEPVFSAGFGGAGDMEHGIATTLSRAEEHGYETEMATDGEPNLYGISDEHCGAEETGFDEPPAIDESAPAPVGPATGLAVCHTGCAEASQTVIEELARALRHGQLHPDDLRSLLASHDERGVPHDASRVCVMQDSGPRAESGTSSWAAGGTGPRRVDADGISEAMTARDAPRRACSGFIDTMEVGADGINEAMMMARDARTEAGMLELR